MKNIRCPKCGEEYSDTYKSCPFCQEEEAIRRGKTPRRRGKRLDKRKRSSGAGGVMLLLTGIIILGVVGYVFFGDQVAAFMGIRSEQGQEDADGTPAEDGQTPYMGQQDPTSGENEDGQPDGEEDPAVGEEPTIPGPLTLSQSDITIPSGEKALLTVTGGTGEVSWSTSNENIATVDGGSVTGVAGGTVTITATAGEESASCKVTVTGDPWVSTANLSLNKTDFTLPAGDPPVQMKVNGTDSPVTWASNNTSVVTISESGVVTRVGRGTTTITATVDGQVLECIVRVP